MDSTTDPQILSLDSHGRTKTMIRTIRVNDLYVRGKLGHGGAAAFYLAETRRRQRRRRNWVAVKKLHHWPAAGPVNQKQSLWWEARLSALAQHRNVLHDLPCMVIQDVPGGSLYDFLHSDRARKLLPWRSRVVIAAQVAAAMEHLHSLGIIHFDLKADNLLVDVTDPDRPKCKIADFGLSCMQKDDMGFMGGCGTLGWMAPEVLGGGVITRKADVYSFGMVMWELVTGEHPYDYDDFGDEELRCAILEVGLRPAVPEWCDPSWRVLMEECWAREAARRPAFGEVAKRLRYMVTALPAGKGSSGILLRAVPEPEEMGGVGSIEEVWAKVVPMVKKYVNF